MPSPRRSSGPRVTTASTAALRASAPGTLLRCPILRRAPKASAAIRWPDDPTRRASALGVAAMRVARQQSLALAPPEPCLELFAPTKGDTVTDTRPSSRITHTLLFIAVVVTAWLGMAVAPSGASARPQDEAEGTVTIDRGYGYGYAELTFNAKGDAHAAAGNMPVLERPGRVRRSRHLYQCRGTHRHRQGRAYAGAGSLQVLRDDRAGRPPRP